MTKVCQNFINTAFFLLRKNGNNPYLAQRFQHDYNYCLYLVKKSKKNYGKLNKKLE